MHFLNRFSPNQLLEQSNHVTSLSQVSSGNNQHGAHREEIAQQRKLNECLTSLYENNPRFQAQILEIAKPNSAVRFNFADAQSFQTLHATLKECRVGKCSLVVSSHYTDMDDKEYCDNQVIIEQSALRSTKRLTDELVEILGTISKKRDA